MLSLLSYDFMQRAFLAVIAMSLFSPVLGTFLILRRQSLMSDTLSHVSLSGVAFGLVLGISPTISTIAIVLIAAVFLEYLRTVYKSFMEIGTAILMSTGLAVSLIVMSKGKSSSSMSLDQYLFWFNRDYQRRAGYFPLCHCGGCFDFDLPLPSSDVHFDL